MTCRIPLGDDLFALVDDDDFAWLSEYSWSATQEDPKRNTRYAHTICRIDGKRVQVLMHRLIAGAKRGQLVDHWNGEGLDNQRRNLRKCTHTENMRNRRVSRTNKLGLKGVYADRGRFRAIIMIRKRQLNLGGFDNPSYAARAYDRAATEHFGEFARLNFSPERDWLFPNEHPGQWPPLHQSGGGRRR